MTHERQIPESRIALDPVVIDDSKRGDKTMKTMELSDEDLKRLMGMCDVVLCDQPISLASKEFNKWLTVFKGRVGEIRYAKH